MAGREEEGRFISGDWGTSSLRLRLVRSRPFAVEEEVCRSWGIASTHAAWVESDEDREPFYLARLAKALEGFSRRVEGLPIYLSGMASAGVGMHELPYAPLPFALEAALPTVTFPCGEACPHEVTLLSGLRWGKRDIMRGEECQVIGVVEGSGGAEVLPTPLTMILPGTHSKHVRLEGGEIVSFRTFLTGDLFQAIAGHTILKHSLSLDPRARDRVAFRRGVERGSAEPLLRELFGIRCATVFGKRSPESNSAYLSGLLIGSELGELSGGSDPLLVADVTFGELYEEALGVLGAGSRMLSLPERVVREAVPRAHALVHRRG